MSIAVISKWAPYFLNQALWELNEKVTFVKGGLERRETYSNIDMKGNEDFSRILKKEF